MKHFLNIILWLALLSPARAATNTAASTSYTDVTNAIAHANLGDTVLLPVGTNAWPETVFISGITLQGHSTNDTVICDGTVMFASDSTLQLSVRSNYLTRVTGIQFTITNNIYANFSGMVEVYGEQSSWRIDNCFFNSTGAKSIRVGDSAYGLIDHNLFRGSNKQYIQVNGSSYGDASWAADDTFGTTNVVCIEDDTFFDASNFGFIDTADGGRVCVRHCTFKGSFFVVHGTETGQRYRSCRQLEVYQNAFIYPSSFAYDDFYTGCDIRGGTAVIFSNTFTGYNSAINLNVYRETDNDPAFTPWYGATGLNGYDNNSVLLLSGNASATSNKLYVASAFWTANQWLGCTVYNSNSVGGVKVCGIVTGNDTKTMTFKSSRTAAYQMYFTNGDPFVVHAAYPTIDQLGSGKGDLMSNDVPVAVWPHQASDPCYFWSNTIYRYENNAYTTYDGAAGSGYPNVKLNRDFFNTVKPGYTPLVYPHPLIASTPFTNTPPNLSITITVKIQL